MPIIANRLLSLYTQARRLVQLESLSHILPIPTCGGQGTEMRRNDIPFPV